LGGITIGNRAQFAQPLIAAQLYDDGIRLLEAEVAMLTKML
jgi:hypothetical protein